jgi:hypothetical protein
VACGDKLNHNSQATNQPITNTLRVSSVLSACITKEYPTGRLRFGGGAGSGCQQVGCQVVVGMESQAGLAGAACSATLGWTLKTTCALAAVMCAIVMLAVERKPTGPQHSSCANLLIQTCCWVGLLLYCCCYCCCCCTAAATAAYHYKTDK